MQFRPQTFAASRSTATTTAGSTRGTRPTRSHRGALPCQLRRWISRGVQRAVLHYNNAQWYVDLVLGVQQKIAAAYA